MVVSLVINAITVPTHIFYTSVFYLFKRWRPAKKYNLRGEEYLTASYIHASEYKDESFKSNKIITLEGSTPSGSSIYIEATVHPTYSTSVVHIAEEGKDYFGEFQAQRGDDEYVLNCGPLTMEMREPFRRWRVVFRGNLRDLATNEDHFTTIGGWWKPTSDARPFYGNAKPSDFLGNVTSTFNIYGNVSRMSRWLHSGSLVQYGQLYLEVGINGKTVQHRYRGVKETLPTNLLGQSDEMHLYLDDGNKFSHKKSSLLDDGATIEHGLVSRADHVVRRIQLSDQSAAHSLEDRDNIEFFDTQNITYPITKEAITSSFSYLRSDSKVIAIKRIKVQKGSLATGYALFKTIRESTKNVDEPVFDTAPEYQASPNECIAVLPFSNRACQDKSLTGGKGANLARLLAMQQNYSVPAGLVVSTTGYLNYLKSNQKIKKLIEELGSHGKNIDHYVAIGEEIRLALLSSSPYDSEEVRKLLPSGQFAVRSSALGEDGSDLSSAGQLESVLNVKPDEIGKSILECWASNFRREVITYRRTHGQILNPPMAVVVQQMITDGVAGVMFTCDPVRNDSNRMVINAVKGLGEQIVSGSTTPDEITVWKHSGNVEKPNKCCLDDAAIHHLVQVGNYLERKFGRAQDVEFVFKNGTLYLVQSRDVTGRDRESHFELLTEFDDATLTDREIFTTANVGEVAPIPYTPLEVSITFEPYDKNMSGLSLREITGWMPHHFHYAFHMSGQRIFFNPGELFLRLYPIIKKDRLAEYTIAGCELFDESMFKQAEERYPVPSPMIHIRRLILMFKLLFSKSYQLLIDVKRYTMEQQALAPPPGDVSFEKLFEAQHEQTKLYAEVIRCHSEESVFSSFTYIMVGMLIKGREGKISSDMMSDFANVFSNSSSMVISADVPASLKKLSRAIVDDGLVEEFCSKDGEEALNVLKKGPTAEPLMKQFWEMHGHRGPNELYLKSYSWAEKPDLLVHTLKTMASAPQNGERETTNVNEDDLVDSLKCQPKGKRRSLMKYMIKQTHRGVANREFAKNHLVLAAQAIRKTMRRVGEKLYDEGYIADKDLYQYLTIEELKTLVATRSPKLVSRAMRRKQIAPELDQFQYEHIYHTNPKPIDTTKTNDFTTTMTMRGTTVCEGTVIARARVAISLEEAKLTQPGEILITRCTDICWSPFFPIIKGIVTEIGGLLSHGAVVAREYGLPSLIAVQHATQVFQTGDLVELNATKGTISKVEQ